MRRSITAFAAGLITAVTVLSTAYANDNDNRGGGGATAGLCGSGSGALPGVNAATLHAQGRCGYGPRLPLMVISPWARRNFVDHTLTDQSSILRFVEDNWLQHTRIGAGSFDTIANPIDNMFSFEHRGDNDRRLFLDPSSGEVQGGIGW